MRKYRKSFRRFRKKFKRTFGRRKFNRRGGRGHLKITSTKLGTILPDRMFFKTYYDFAQVIPGASFPLLNAWNAQQFKGNSLLNPNATSGGGSYTLVGTIQRLYNFYHVTATKITLEIQAMDTTSATQVALWPTQSQTEAATDAADQEFVKLAMVPSNGNGKVRVKNYMTSDKMFGLKTTNENDYTGGFNPLSNPTALFFWQLSYRNIPGSVNATLGIQVSGRMKVYAIARERITSLP